MEAPLVRFLTLALTRSAGKRPLPQIWLDILCLAMQRRNEQALGKKQRAQGPTDAAVNAAANKTQQVRLRKADSSSDPYGTAAAAVAGTEVATRLGRAGSLPPHNTSVQS